MLPVTLAVEPYSNSRVSSSSDISSIGISASASDQFVLFVNITPAFIDGIGAVGSLGTLTSTGEIRPKISGILMSGYLGDVSAEVYFGNSIQISGYETQINTLSLFAEGQIVDNQAYPSGLFLEMRVGTFNVYLDQWETYIPPTDAWEEYDKYELFCEV